MRALRRSSGIPRAFLFHDASFPSAAGLVRLLNDRKSIIGLHIAVAASKRHAEAGHASVGPGLIAHAESLPQPVADAAGAQLELPRNALANEQRRRHPLGRDAYGPRGFVLALSLVALARAGIRDQ
eukprot:7228175-Pyramimonas_sp.AAC.1